MNSKILASAVVVSVAVLSAWGCASAPMTAGGGTAPFDCPGNACTVPLRYNFPGSIDGPDVIQVNVDAATPVTVTWELKSVLGTRFDARGIVFADPLFQCAAVSATQFKCTGTGLQRGKSYKYTVTLVGGFLPPFPWDPYIRN